MTTYSEFLESVVNSGIEGAKADYCKPEDKDRLDGSIEGFEACRGKSPAELLSLLEVARKATMDAFHGQVSNYWRIRSREAEVEWVCNVVSAALVNVGAIPIIQPTVRGVMQAARMVANGAMLTSDEVPA